MRKEITLKSKLFRSTTNNGVEEKANNWLKQFLKEEKRLRTAWVDGHGVYWVEATGVVCEGEVK